MNPASKARDTATEDEMKAREIKQFEGQQVAVTLEGGRKVQGVYRSSHIVTFDLAGELILYGEVTAISSLAEVAL